MSTPSCTIRVTYGWGPVPAAQSEPCGLPAARVIATACLCGHTGTTSECEDHMETIKAEDRFCHECNAVGHYCSVSIRVLSRL